VGFDPPEEPNPTKITQALENLVANCLAPSGKVVVTLPLGYNLSMDRSLLEGVFPSQEITGQEVQIQPFALSDPMTTIERTKRPDDDAGYV
jgi:hypothetical protein